jgi:hypothetical protein
MIPRRIRLLVHFACIDAVDPVQSDAAVGCCKGNGVSAVRSPGCIYNENFLKL